MMRRRFKRPFLPADLQPIRVHRNKKSGLGEYDTDNAAFKDIGIDDHRNDTLPIDLATRLFYVRKNRLLEQGQPTLKDKDSLLQFIAQNTSYIASTKILRRVVYVGNSGVATGSGFPLFGMDKLEIYPEENCELWAVAGSSLNIRILEL